MFDVATGIFFTLQEWQLFRFCPKHDPLDIKTTFEGKIRIFE